MTLKLLQWILALRTLQNLFTHFQFIMNLNLSNDSTIETSTANIEDMGSGSLHSLLLTLRLIIL